MNIEVIKLSDYKEFEWSGGKTTEFYIRPRGADFKKRDFDYRLSSATFSGTESTFSDFSGYRRHILPLKGSLSLKEEGGEKRWLKPYQSFRFDGAIKMESENTPDCADFNFIVREGLESDLRVYDKAEDMVLREGATLLIYGSDMGIDFSVRGAYLCGLNLSEKRLILIEAEESCLDIKLKRLSSPVIACYCGRLPESKDRSFR